MNSISTRPLACGDRVFNKRDPRHVGRVESVTRRFAHVRFDNGTHASEPVEQFQHAREGE